MPAVAPVDGDLQEELRQCYQEILQRGSQLIAVLRSEDWGRLSTLVRLRQAAVDRVEAIGFEHPRLAPDPAMHPLVGELQGQDRVLSDLMSAAYRRMDQRLKAALRVRQGLGGYGDDLLVPPGPAYINGGI